MNKLSYIISALLISFATKSVAAKDKIHALYIPLADHYPAIVAHDKYAKEMKHADYSVEMMKSWPALSGKFMSGQADIAFIVSPLAMNMYRKKGNFQMVSLAHRDGNALAVNDEFLKDIALEAERSNRKPTEQFAKAAKKWRDSTGKATISGVPSLESTHTVVLYKYLKDNGLKLAVGRGEGDVLAKSVAPPKSPSYIKNQAKAGIPASFEQSLPWADVVESQGFGKVVWYSKDIIPWNNGHVECIIIATNDAIINKKEALKEVIEYIHKAGADIQNAMVNGGTELKELATIINNKYVKLHSVESIEASLSSELDVINYKNLNNDEAGLKVIMDLAVESGVMPSPIDIEAFSNKEFSVDLTSSQK